MVLRAQGLFGAFGCIIYPTQTRPVWDCQSGLPINSGGGARGNLSGAAVLPNVPDRSCMGSFGLKGSNGKV